MQGPVSDRRPSIERAYRAPGRINLIGEHTDYNDGFVLPTAIRFETRVVARARDDARLVVRSHGFDGTRTFDLAKMEPGVANDWSDHVRGIAIELQREDAVLRGCDLAIESDVPVGAGLSSSASVMVAAGCALLAIANAPIDRVALAKAARRAENEHVGARTGIMDPFVSANARAGHALLLDTRSLAYDHVPLPTHATIVVCNSMVKHAHASSGYNDRRRECELGTAALAARFPHVRALRDATLAMLADVAGSLSPDVFRRSRHIITENDRTERAAATLRAGDLAAFGALMTASHASMRDDFAISCPEIDFLVASAASYAGGRVYGARMTGGGFGGCAIALVDSGVVDDFADHLRATYRAAYDVVPDVYVGAGAAGASAIPA